MLSGCASEGWPRETESQSDASEDRRPVFRAEHFGTDPAVNGEMRRELVPYSQFYSNGRSVVTIHGLVGVDVRDKRHARLPRHRQTWPRGQVEPEEAVVGGSPAGPGVK